MLLLERNGLSQETLDALSFESRLGISLKRNLHYFERDALLEELFSMANWLDENELLGTLDLDFRIKSEDSIALKYERYYPDQQTRKVFNDVLGFRILCDSYDTILQDEASGFRIADLSHGKAKDDGYRGVHVYYQKTNRHYPIEIQCNTPRDRIFNDWLHDFLYKKDYSSNIGKIMREKYEQGRIKTAAEFEEVLNRVLRDSKRT